MFKEGQNYVLLCDKVDGLAASSPVLLHGMKVGTVLEMEYDANSDLISVIFSLYDRSMRLPKDTRLTVVSELLGTSDLILEMGESKDCYEPGDTIVAPPAAASLLAKADPIVANVELLMPKLDTLITGITVLVNESKLHESLINVNTLTTQLNTTVNELNRMLRRDMPQVMGNLKNITSNIDTVSNQLKEAEIDQILSNANNTLLAANQLLQEIRQDDSTIGKLLNTSELHDQLNQTIADVDSLINDIKKNPKRYINVKVF